MPKMKKKANKKEDNKTNRECDFCEKKAVIFVGVDEAGHLNYECEECGEPQDD